MRPNTVKQKWREGKPAIGCWLGIPSSYSAEMMAHQGFDWVCVDTQHGAIDYNTAFPMIQAIASTSAVPFVRVPWNEPSIIMKYLDAGAYGIIVPMIETKADAEAAVWAMRYPPQGMRSSGPFRATLYAGPDYQDRANDELLLAVMIETPKALENLDEIASVPGIDVLYIGPSDLSQALGLGPRYNADNPRHAETVTRIRQACERHGVIPGVHTSGNVLTNRYIKEGFKMILLTTDAGGISSGARRELDAVQDAVKAASTVRA
ncbi:MAG TPA: aldolase/citrate lyase family protein [Dehalococcoidia bacterium]